MPIRIIRDDTPGEARPDNDADLPAIVVKPPDTTYNRPKDPPADQVKQPPIESKAPSIEAKGSPDANGLPKPTTWAMVACQCTTTGRSYQLTFRHENDQFVLKAIDRQISGAASNDVGGIEGPFEWSGFECPECRRGWTKGDDNTPAWPVLMCSCKSLFCTRKGVYSKKGKDGPEWWWSCPKCRVDALVELRLESLEGVAIKGK